MPVKKPLQPAALVFALLLVMVPSTTAGAPPHGEGDSESFDRVVLSRALTWGDDLTGRAARGHLLVGWFPEGERTRLLLQGPDGGLLILERLRRPTTGCDVQRLRSGTDSGWWFELQEASTLRLPSVETLGQPGEIALHHLEQEPEATHRLRSSSGIAAELPRHAILDDRYARLAAAAREQGLAPHSDDSIRNVLSWLVDLLDDGSGDGSLQPMERFVDLAAGLHLEPTEMSEAGSTTRWSLLDARGTNAWSLDFSDLESFSRLFSALDDDLFPGPGFLPCPPVEQPDLRAAQVPRD